MHHVSLRGRRDGGEGKSLRLECNRYAWGWGVREAEGVGPPWLSAEEAEKRTVMDCLEEGWREDLSVWETGSARPRGSGGTEGKE